MYDAKNEAHEFTAATRDEAIRKATDFFEVDVAELVLGGFPDGEVYGLGGAALVVASLRNRTRPTGRSSDDGGRGDRGGRGARRSEGRDDREGRGRGRGRDRDRGGRGGSDRGERSERSERSERPERSERSERPERSERAESAAPSPSSEPSVGTAQGEIGEIGKFILGVVERMDVGPFEIGENADGDTLAFELRGAAAEILASGDGRTVDALQLLANQVAQRNELDSRVVVDVEGDADAREDLLARLASRAASRAKKSGRAVALDPMNGRDRRHIHIALRDEDGVATMSVGEGRYRQVVIVPEGAPEYEDAVRESESAASNDD